MLPPTNKNDKNHKRDKKDHQQIADGLFIKFYFFYNVVGQTYSVTSAPSAFKAAKPPATSIKL